MKRVVREVVGSVLVLVLVAGCGESHGDAQQQGGAGGKSGNAGASAGGAGAALGGAASGGVSTGGGSMASRGGMGAGAGDGSPFDGLTLKPDADATPVADCAGQKDLTLCEVVTTPDRSYDICVGGVCVSPGCGDPSCNSPAPHFLPPPASDHTYFQTIAGDEPVVVDLVTGLHWQACTSGYTGATCQTGMQQRMNWDAALAYCDGLSWGGKDDWYLPDSYELLSILDYAKATEPPVLPGSVALDATLFPNHTSQYWTSHYVTDTAVFGLQIFGFKLDIGSTILSENRTEEVAVRCARRGFSRDAGYAEKRYELHAPVSQSEKVIWDLAAGLIWQGCLSGRSGVECELGSLQKVPVPDWQGYCADLTWAGYSDWRLPTYKELHGLARYPTANTHQDPEVDETVFDIADANYLGCTSGWGADAVNFLFDTYDADTTGPGGSTYPIMCVRWK